MSGLEHLISDRIAGCSLLGAGCSLLGTGVGCSLKYFKYSKYSKYSKYLPITGCGVHVASCRMSH